MVTYRKVTIHTPNMKSRIKMTTGVKITSSAPATIRTGRGQPVDRAPDTMSATPAAMARTMNAPGPSSQVATMRTSRNTPHPYRMLRVGRVAR